MIASTSAKTAIFLLRVTIGWMMLYAGVTKIINPLWSAAPYLNNAKTFPDFFRFLANPELLPLTNFINEWGLTLIGISLILGVGVYLSSLLGALLMLLYYFPILDFPYPNPHALIVDEHIIYFAALLVLGSLNAGRIFGLEKWCSNLPFFVKHPKIKKLTR